MQPQTGSERPGTLRGVPWGEKQAGNLVGVRGFQQGTISMSILVEDHFIHLVICHQLSCVQNSANVSILHNLILIQFLMAYILYVIESSKQNRDLTSTGSSPKWWQQPDLDQAKAKGLELPTCSPRGVAGALS